MPRRSWPLAVVAGAGLAVPLLTRRTMSFPPSMAVGAALAVLLVLSLLGRSRFWRRLDPAIATAMGVASVAQYLEPGTVWGHDSMHHLWGAYAYLEAWRAGDYLPIWLHHLGLGEPMPLFYGPLGFWAMAPAALAGAGPRGMFAATFVLASVTATLAARGVVLAWTRDRRSALVAATAMAFAPYRLCDANYRSAVGESWAIALLPLVLFAYHRLLTRGGRRDFARAAAVSALMALAHPISLILVVVLLSALWAALQLSERARPTRALAGAVRSIAAAFCGLTLAGFFILPVLTEKIGLNLGDLIPSREKYVQEAVFARQIVDRQLWDRIRYSELTTSTEEDMPFYLGVVGLASLVAATSAARRHSRSAALGGVIGLLGAAAAAASTLPVARWAAHLPGVPTLQFPWRFLGPASVAAALAAGLVVARGRGARSQRWLAAAAALALLADGFAFTGTVRRVAPWRGLGLYTFTTRQFATTIDVPPPWPPRVAGAFLPPAEASLGGTAFVAEVLDDWLAFPFGEYFTPRTHILAESKNWQELSVGLVGWSLESLKRIDGRPYARLRHGPGDETRAVPWERVGGRIDVHTTPRSGELTVAEEYFPGWQVRAGNSWREVEPGPDGLLTTHVPKGVRLVEFRFDRWRGDRLLGWIASGATLALLAVLAFWPPAPRFAPHG